MKKTIILYNPAAPYYNLPLQFLALASVIDREKYDVRIIDARIERSVHAAHKKVRELLPNAACLGISVITGTPIKDASAVSLLSRSVTPSVPIIWGGWHPSIYPEQCLREGPADYCVFGQGEVTFIELLEAIESNSGFERIAGLAYIRDDEFYQNEERKFIDINQFPSYDYSLLPVESYFRKKRMRQIDFYSSQGCPYRCGFCADPYVYGRRWSGLKGNRMLDDVFGVVREFRADEVLFQDENFFANQRRVIDFSRGVLQQDMQFSWVATSRADQIAPLDDGLLAELSRSNLRKVIIGAESGSQEMLDFMKKDTLAEESVESAARLASHGIGASFNFIVGFPEERFGETLKTLNVIKEIKRVSPKFEFNIFFYTPYPGTDLFDYITGKGYRVPHSLEEWSEIDFIFYSGYWVRQHEREYVDRFKFYMKLADGSSNVRIWPNPLRALAAARTRRDYYDFPVEAKIVNFVRHKILNEVNW